MKEALVDVPVLVIFFNRPALLEMVFEQIRRARPSKLFLYQDGARGERDLEGILKCREVVANIDWECEVHKFYQEKNMGCDPSEFISQKWAFSIVDKCIVLEDDDVPSVSFFSFCKELLDKYENDTRISMIAGMNHEEITTDIPYDYFFTSNLSIWGWASWRRVIDTWDETYSFLNDSFSLGQIRNIIKQRKMHKAFIETAQWHKSTGKAYYESIFQANVYLNSGLCIVPTRNMINNLGASSESTHFTASEEMIPKGLRRIFTMKRYELENPIKHPLYIIEHVAYKDRVYKINAWGHPMIKVSRSFEELYLRICHGDFKGILQAIRNRIKKTLHIR